MLNHRNNDVVDGDVEQQLENDTDVLHRERGRIHWPRRIRSNSRNLLPRNAATYMSDSEAFHASALRMQALELLFGLSADHASRWPGILVFCQHLEHCFEELLNPQFDILWKILQRRSPVSAVDCWHWCFAVINTFHTSQDDDPSMEKIYQQLLHKEKKPLHEITPLEKMRVLRAMFAILCWTSATLKPLLNDGETNTTARTTPAVVQNMTSMTAENALRRYSTKDLRRPTSKMFYFFQNHAEGIEDIFSSGNPHSINSNDVLYESSLNYFSLYTICQVRLKWVDTLTAHLDFDRSTRTLSVFRFPSFCATNVLRANDIKVLKNITTKLLPSHYHTDSLQEPSALHREILLSYRLLFGQSTKARKLLAKVLNQSISTADITMQSNHSSTNRHSCSSARNATDGIDPFLATICTSPIYSRWSCLNYILRGIWSPPIPSKIFPSSALDLSGQLQESDTYSAHGDFSIFGSRLLTLQHYNMRQQPSKVKDLWRDRRSPLQWYTFWAVLLFGGASIVLATLQLLISAAQLYFAVRSLP